jgi:hypothetical protein
MQNIINNVKSVTCAPPAFRKVWAGKRDGTLTVSAVVATVRYAGLDITATVYAKAQGKPERVTDMKVRATFPNGIDASEAVKGALLAHIEAHVQGWSGWRDAVYASFNALRTYEPGLGKNTPTMDLSGFEAKPEPKPEPANADAITDDELNALTAPTQ